MAEARIGTVDIPERTERERYFRELSYLELSALFAGPLKPAALARWAEVAPRGALGLVAPWVLTHRKAPAAARLWRHDGTVGDFRDSAPGRDALGPFRAALEALGAAHAIFRSPPLFAPSAVNRDRLRSFFAEVASAEALGGVTRVWIPDGLWEPRTAASFAAELGVACALDPLVREPGLPPEIFYDLEIPALYLRISGLGRAGRLSDDQLEEIAALVEHYDGVPATVAFESAARWNDARNLKKLLAELLPAGGGGGAAFAPVAPGADGADDGDGDDADDDDDDGEASDDDDDDDAADDGGADGDD